MKPALFTLRLLSGETWTGSIHGSGGLIKGGDARRRVELLIRIAGVGHPLPVAEPQPGHVIGHRRLNERDTAEQIVDLRGAEVLACDHGDAGGAS